MICNECKLEAGISKATVEKYEIPFKCDTCGNIKFSYKALNGVVFIWPKPIKEKTEGGIVIPEFAQQNFKSSTGVILSSGKGCKNKRTNKYVESELSVGDIVIYDKNIPWKQDILGTDGKEHQVDLANILDINAIIEERED